MKLNLEKIKEIFKGVNLCYIIPAVIFVGIIFSVSVLTLVGNGLTIVDSVKRNKIDVLATCYEVESIFKNSMKGIDSYINVWSLSEKTIRENNIIRDMFPYQQWPSEKEGFVMDNGALIVDGQNKLHFPYYVADLNPCITSIKRFAGHLEEKEIPLCYVQLPNKVLEGYTVLPAEGVNVANEMATAFLNNIDDVSNLKTYDLRHTVVAENHDRESMFYATDHHWTTETAFWSFQKLVEYLNEEYYLGLDKTGYYRDINNYQVTTYEDCFLGSQGKRVGKYTVGLDDYTFIEPKFDTNYTVLNSAYEEEGLLGEGSFRDTIVIEQYIEGKADVTNRHAAYFGGDFAATIIKNHNADNDLRLLVIKDSFSLPLVAFMSTCVSEIHMVDLRPSDAILPKDYIEKYDFDMVMVVYNTEVFGVPMFNFMTR